MPQMSDAPLDQISPRYEISSQLPVGEGGCGVVWRATDLLFGKPVALKLLKRSLLEALPRGARRSFWKEAQTGARLGQASPHIVKVLDYGLVNDEPFFTMEWLDARDGHTLDLHSLIGCASLAETMSIATDAASGISVAHQSGIIHSDISPWNILRPATGGAKVADFGLLRIVESSLVSAASGSLLSGGRADYQPPEVRLSIKNLTKAADVYALAVTVLVLLVGTKHLPSVSGGNIEVGGGDVITRDQRIIPQALKTLFDRYITNHSTSHTIDDFRRDLAQVPRT